MQQRQPRLGDILDDYCPRERRLTNHAVVAMVGDEIKQTRCTTCDADHEYKHAKIPRPRTKTEAAGALAHSAAAPRRVPPNASPGGGDEAHEEHSLSEHDEPAPELTASPRDEEPREPHAADDDEPRESPVEEGPVHRRLIRATLPRTEGQPPPERPAPDFTIRQPGGRSNRFRGRQRGGGVFAQGRSSNGNFGPPRGNSGRQGPGRPPSPSRSGGRHGSGRKRSK
jgi:hypothetical protein